MKLSKAWPDPEPIERKDAEETKGSKVFPKSLVESTVEKSLSELLKQSFKDELTDLSEQSEEDINNENVENHKVENLTKPTDMKKTFPYKTKSKKSLKNYAFKTEDKPGKEKLANELKNTAYSGESESIKYIWIALGSFCLLAFLFLNSILSKLKTLENLISRQTKELTN